MKINQYLLISFYVSVSMFFSSNGKSESSPNCDSALGVSSHRHSGGGIDYYFSLHRHPTDHLHVCINFVSVAPPLFHADLFKELDALSTSDRHNRIWKKVSIKWRRFAAISSVDWFILESSFNFAFSLQQNLQSFISSSRKVFGDRPMDQKLHLVGGF